MGNITQKRVDVLKVFGKDYFRKISASKIAKEINMPQQTVSRIMNTLEKDNILKSEKQGKNKLFFLNKEHPGLNIVLNIIENFRTLEFNINSSKISIIISELLKYCESIILFGSYASGKQKETSDLDIAVFNVKNKNKFNQIVWSYSKEINPHFFSYLEFKKMLNKKVALAEEIKKNHVFFGNISRLVGVMKNG
ncbi:MAG: nucleotidyltransferase domain-containing protein [Nanoarchaeota archaeon]